MSQPKIVLGFAATGSVVYCFVRRTADGAIYNPTTGAFVVDASPVPATYRNAMAEDALMPGTFTKSAWTGLAWNDGDYLVGVYSFAASTYTIIDSFVQQVHFDQFRSA